VVWDEAENRLHVQKAIPVNRSSFQLETPEPKIAALIYFVDMRKADIAINATPVPRLFIYATLHSSSRAKQHLYFYTFEKNRSSNYKSIFVLD
jgi:hypothetical protein